MEPKVTVEPITTDTQLNEYKSWLAQMEAVWGGFFTIVMSPRLYKAFTILQEVLREEIERYEKASQSNYPPI